MKKSKSYKSNIQEIQEINKDLETLKEEWTLPDVEIRQITLVIEELFSKVVQRVSPEREDDIIDINYKHENNSIEISLLYPGDRYNPLSETGEDLSDLTNFDSENIGISLMNAFVNSLEYSRSGETNQLTIRKSIKSKDS